MFGQNPDSVRITSVTKGVHASISAGFHPRLVVTYLQASWAGPGSPQLYSVGMTYSRGSSEDFSSEACGTCSHAVVTISATSTVSAVFIFMIRIFYSMLRNDDELKDDLFRTNLNKVRYLEFVIKFSAEVDADQIF
jgi:hypothetical protein